MERLMLLLFYKWVWQFKPIYCECGCNKKLSLNINLSSIDHIKEKSIYPQYKYSKSNIMFLHPDCHSNKTQGFKNKNMKDKLEWANNNLILLSEENIKFVNKLKNIINGEI